MLVRDVMTTEVKTTAPGETILDAVKTMNEFRIGCLVVISRSRLAGIITERDVLRNVVGEDLLASKTLVKQAMTRDPVMIEDDSDISDAVDLMNEHGIKKLPVVSGHNIVGIITTTDLARVQPELIKQVTSVMSLPKKPGAVAG